MRGFLTSALICGAVFFTGAASAEYLVVRQAYGFTGSWYGFQLPRGNGQPPNSGAGYAFGCEGTGQFAAVGDSSQGLLRSFKYEIELWFSWSHCDLEDAPQPCSPVVTDRRNEWNEGSDIPPHPGSGDEGFGDAVWMSSDGHRIAVGHFGDRSIQFYRRAWSYVLDPGEFQSTPRPTYWTNRIADMWIPEDRVSGLTRDLGSVLALSDAGNRMVVGESPVNGQGDDGGVRNFDGVVEVWDEGEDTGWVRAATLLPPIADAGTGFGSAVAISGDGRIVVVGAPYEVRAGEGPGAMGDDAPLALGAAYVFERVGNSYIRRARLTVDAPTDQLFTGLAVDTNYTGSVIYVGVPGYPIEKANPGQFEIDPYERSAGGIAVWRRDGNQYEGVGVVVSTQPQADAEFGAAISSRGRSSILAVGSPGRRGEDGAFSGLAMVGSANEGLGRFLTSSNRYGDGERLGIASESCGSRLAMFGEPSSNTAYINGHIGEPSYMLYNTGGDDGGSGGDADDDDPPPEGVLLPGGLQTTGENAVIAVENVVELVQRGVGEDTVLGNVVGGVGNVVGGVLCALLGCR